MEMSSTVLRARLINAYTSFNYLVSNKELNGEVKMEITREWAMPNANTFSIPPIRRFVESNVIGKSVVIDPFANKSKFGTITNDLNPEYDTDYHLDALAFLKEMKSDSADVVLFDPPYNVSQAKQCYDNFGKEKLNMSVTNNKYWTDCKKEVSRILKVGGVALCFGWSSNGIGKGNGMRMDNILIVAHGGLHYDTICTKEIKIENIAKPLDFDFGEMTA